MILGKLEVTIKINELPQAKIVENNWQQFDIDCDGRIITLTVKPKIWRKLSDAASNYPQWVAAISGKIGQPTEHGFVLDEPNIQVFERQPKESTITLGQLEKTLLTGNFSQTKEVKKINNLAGCENNRSSVRSSLSTSQPTMEENKTHIKI
ncbi:hypothetical protein [Nostoc sp. TCL26-01]|uniref:hypothetical protein n=1 Tax=Nostoc sp. TCL26-01 TaxID=2576904 RepID=UPI00211821A0|nr:hypothetical protein [Nostoc sp. TCL26-01]